MPTLPSATNPIQPTSPLARLYLCACADTSTPGMEQRIRAVIALMEGQLHRDLTLEEMARHVNLSPSYLRHLFKEETGTSPARFLKALRLEKAKALIEGTFLSLKQIMDKVGIKDRRHFAKDFKKAYGLAPAIYRKRYREAELTNGAADDDA